MYLLGECLQLLLAFRQLCLELLHVLQHGSVLSLDGIELGLLSPS